MEEGGEIDTDHEDFTEVMAKLENAAFVEQVLKSEEWGIFRKAWKQIADGAREALTTVPPTDYEKIIQLQLQAQFYDHILDNTVKLYKEEGQVAYEHAKERGWLRNIYDKLNNLTH